MVYGMGKIAEQQWYGSANDRCTEGRESQTMMVTVSRRMVGVAVMGTDGQEARESQTTMVTASGNMVGAVVMGADVCETYL